MKYIAKFSMIAAVLLGLGGCVTAIDPAQNGGGTRSTSGGGFPVMGGGVTAKDFPQICQAAKENAIRADKNYGNRQFSGAGEVISIGNAPGILDKYIVHIKAGQFNINAKTNNTSVINQLSVGKSVNVSGQIDYVNNGYDGCSVGLRNASF